MQIWPAVTNNTDTQILAYGLVNKSCHPTPAGNYPRVQGRREALVCSGWLVEPYLGIL